MKGGRRALKPFGTNRGNMRQSFAFAGLLPRGFAIGLGLLSAGPEYACRVRGAQIAAIVRCAPLVIVANGVAASILLVALDNAGKLSWPGMLWGCILTLCLMELGRVWRRAQRRGGSGRPASRKAIVWAVLHGGLIGAVWGMAPCLVHPADPPSLQVLAGCLTIGTIAAGGFILATIPLAGFLFVALMLAGATRAILSQPYGISELCLLPLLWAYGALVLMCLSRHAHLFVEHFLTEARLQAEIGARERAQAEVAHARRMSALGALAGGVAHDFGNVLQSVTGNASLVMSRGGDQQTRHLAGLILDAAERGAAVSRRLLAFARPDALSAEPVDLGDLLSGAAGLLEHTLHRSIRLSVRAPPDLPLVLADKAQLETVLVNLAANARDAMPRGGTLSFEATMDPVPAELAHPGLAAGPHVRIAVSDTGAGMAAAVLERAAEPFFTTKPKGKGTGLGLSMAKGFAEQSGGAFSIASEPGAGTVVRLWLPQAGEPAPAWRPGRMAPAGTLPARRLLVAEDDGDVRESLVRTLEEAGFDAIGVADAMGAQRLLERGLEIDLLITDHAMPGITGLELLNEVQARRPSLPGILLTGHVDDVPEALGGRVVPLRKPVHASQLIHHVWQSLSAQMVS
jgi:signal transduction histidine kinase/CheY-like chemotaxis protein